MSDTEEEVSLVREVDSEYDSSVDTDEGEELPLSNLDLGEIEANCDRLGAPVPPPPPPLNLLELRLQYPEQLVR